MLCIYLCIAAFQKSVYLIRNHLPSSIYTSECILPYETKCVKAAFNYFLSISSQAKTLDLVIYVYLRLKRWVFKFYLIYYSVEEVLAKERP